MTLDGMSIDERRSLVDSFLQANVTARLTEIAEAEKAEAAARAAYTDETDEVLGVFRRGVHASAERRRSEMTSIYFYAPAATRQARMTQNPNVAQEDRERSRIERKRSRHRLHCACIYGGLLIAALIAANLVWPV